MRYGQTDVVSWLSFDGAMRYTECREMKAFLERTVFPSMADTMVIDLRSVESVDSTALGLLALIGRTSLSRFSRRAVILVPEGNVAQCLRAMQFDKLFTMSESLDQPRDLQLKPVSIEASPEPLVSVMLGAHKELSSLDDRNKARFNDVVDVLEQAVKRRR
ncbi:MAG: anti-sigma factor antagonist [Archangium sp.]|nr:anti-sigma factor antagonist [Archangium sp.]